ncbi:unnamed protein product [Effrenium voratum]|nr:unnamed protein product [Effrenium voratum]
MAGWAQPPLLAHPWRHRRGLRYCHHRFAGRLQRKPSLAKGAAIALSLGRIGLYSDQRCEPAAAMGWNGGSRPLQPQRHILGGPKHFACRVQSPVFTDTRFEDLGLDERLLKGLEASLGRGARLTPVQQRTLSRLSEGRPPDLLLQAHTGTGKTIAFLLPSLQRLLLREEARRTGVPQPEGVSVLVLAPTRELVLQLAKVSSRLLQYSGGLVRSSFVAGGFSMQDDIGRLRADGPQILFATPWRLVRHLQTTPHFVSALKSIELLVLDEADRLLDPSFVHKVDYVFRCLPSARPQMLLCSATFSEPMRKFAVRSMRAHLEVINTVAEEIGQASEAYPQAQQAQVAQPVDQVLVRYQPEKFLPVLHALLTREMQCEGGDHRRVLVIFPTVRWLQFFYVLLKHRVNMPGLFALHRSLSDDRRRSRAACFSKGAPPMSGILFATDLAARGMDFDVHAVVQVGPPSDREQYVHRAGRTGRLESRGRSFLLLNPLEEAVLQELSGLRLHEETIQEAVGLDAVMEKMHGWWEDTNVSASGHLFYASATAFYLKEMGLVILQQHGGLYVDVDFECLQPLDDLHRAASFYTGLSNVGAFELNNGLFAAAPGHALLSFLCEHVDKPWPEWGEADVDPAEAVAYQLQRSGMLGMELPKGKASFLATTGPGFFTRAVMRAVTLFAGEDPGVLICPPEVFYPLPNGKRKLPLEEIAAFRTRSSMAVHHWLRTWGAAEGLEEKCACCSKSEAAQCQS